MIGYGAVTNRFSLALDSTQISALLTCPRQWKYAYRDSIVHRYQKTEAIDWGSIFHALIEFYYNALKDGYKWDEAQCDTLKVLDGICKEVKTILSKEDKKFIEQRFIYWVQRWTATNQELKILEVEKGFSIPILDNENFFFVLEGRIDMIGENKQGIKMWMDHKTQDSARDLYDHSIQFLNYSYATGLSYGIIDYITWAQTINDKTFRRQLLHYSPEKLRQWKSRLLTYFYKATNLIISNHYEKNESQCGGKFNSPCEFTQLCEETSEHVRQGLIQINYMEREKWLPWHL
jgi:hypothetical protein